VSVVRASWPATIRWNKSYNLVFYFLIYLSDGKFVELDIAVIGREVLILIITYMGWTSCLNNTQETFKEKNACREIFSHGVLSGFQQQEFELL